MENKCDDICKQAAGLVAENLCKNKGKNINKCVKIVRKRTYNDCMRANKNTKCDCKGKCQIAANYKCKYEIQHRNQFKNYKDCLSSSNKDCNDKMGCNSTNKDVLKSMNLSELENEDVNEGENELENEDENEDENNGDSYEDEEVLSKCDCPCCMKGGCNKRGYSSIWYALFVILIVLLFISMFASLVYDSKKGMKRV